jgi:CheY-like chemotaxis protein
LLTLLVVEDEFAVLEVLSVALEGAGYRVLKAGDGSDALRVLAHRSCDLVICDESMPVIDGPQLIAAIRAEPRLAHLPVIMLAETWGRELPVLDDVAVIGKPVYLAELFRRIEVAVAAPRPR